MSLHPKTTEALAACREALHALEAESHARRRNWSAAQAIPRSVACVSMRNVIAAIESERDPQPDDAESNAIKRFLMEQMEQCQYQAPACSYCAAIERLLIVEGYRVEAPRVLTLVPVSENTEGATVLDPAAPRSGDDLVGHVAAAPVERS